jgi:hypothetical protein
MSSLIVRLIAIALVICLGTLFGPAIDTAQAHGGGVPQLINAEAGPYWVSVWTQPNPLRVGQAHITVAVSEPPAASSSQREAGAPVLDAMVQVQLQPLAGSGEPRTASATHEGAANKLLYETDLHLAEAGSWQVWVAVDGVQGSGKTGFQVEVAEASRSRWPWVAGLAIAGLGALWMVQQTRAKQEQV